MPALSIKNASGMPKRNKHMEVLKKLAPTRKQKEQTDVAEMFAYELMSMCHGVNTRSPERIAQILENYQLHAGKWPDIKAASKDYKLKVEGQEISFAQGEVRHYPLVDRVSQAMVGDIGAAGVRPNIRDTTRGGTQKRMQVRAERTQAFLESNFIKPMQDRIRLDYYAKLGIQDPNAIPVEQQKQIASEIESRIQAETPVDFEKDLTGIKLEVETIGQKLIDGFVRTKKVAELFAYGGADAVSNAEEYYRVQHDQGKLNIECLDLLNTQWYGSSDCRTAQKAQVAYTSKWLTPHDLISKYSGEINLSGVDDISTLLAKRPSQGKTTTERSRIRDKNKSYGQHIKSKDRTTIRTADAAGVDILTREGQNQLWSLFATMSQRAGAEYGIEEEYVTWRWARRLKKVYRRNPETREIERFYFDEHYVPNDLIDLEVVDILAPEIWEATCIGNQIWHNVRPVPYQYKSIADPFDVDLPIFGQRYNDANGTTHPTSHVDKGKIWNLRFNQLMRKLEEDEALDIGKVLSVSTTAIPDGWGFSDFVKSVVRNRITMVNDSADGFDQQNRGSGISSTDLSRNSDVANTIKKLEYAESMVISVMYSSPDALGSISQYASGETARMNVRGSDRISRDFHTNRRSLMRDILQYCLRSLVRMAPDNPEIVDGMLSDKEISYLISNKESIQSTDLEVEVEDSITDNEELNSIKGNLINFLAGKDISPSELIDFFRAKSLNELHERARKYDRKREREGAASAQQQLAQLQEAEQKAEALRKTIRAEKLQDEQAARQHEIERARIFSSQQERANDVDRDGVNDANTRAESQRIHEAFQNERDRAVRIAETSAKIDADLLKAGIKKAEKIEVSEKSAQTAKEITKMTTEANKSISKAKDSKKKDGSMQ